MYRHMHSSNLILVSLSEGSVIHQQRRSTTCTAWTQGVIQHMVLKIHARDLHTSRDSVGALLDPLASNRDLLRPCDRWPAYASTVHCRSEQWEVTARFVLVLRCTNRVELFDSGLLACEAFMGHMALRSRTALQEEYAFA
jgi:hypothetical protein